MPETLDADTRRVEVRWYSGATVERVPLFAEPFKLTFDLKGAKLDRLNAGAPLLAAHDDSTLDGVLGVVERAWVAADGGHAVVRFSDRAEVEPIFRDVQNGVLRSVSMGAVIHEIRDVTPKAAKQREFEATSWTVHELSLVPIGADAAAQTLSQQGDRFPCRLISEVDMSDTTIHDDGGDELTAEQTRAQLREYRRRDRIRTLAAHFEQGEEWTQGHIDAGSSVPEVTADGRRLQAEAAPHIDGRVRVSVIESWDRGPRRNERMAAGIAARLRGVEPTDPARQFYHYTFGDAALDVLGDRRPSFVRPPSEWEAIRLALTTSDFPVIAANVAHQFLQPAYMQAEPTYRRIARRQNVVDFKPQSLIKAGDFPLPLQVLEGAEITLGTISESGETATLLSYGRRLTLTRALLVNDGTGALTRVLSEYGRRLVDLENSLFFTKWTSGASSNGPVMSDAQQFFSAGHSNLSGVNSAIDVIGIGTGVAAMRKQTSLDGLKLNVAPRFLLAGPDREVVARQYCATINPTSSSSVNPFGGVIEPLADANLSGNVWFLIADPSVLSAYVYGSLDSEPGPRIATRPGFETEGLEIRVAIDWYTAALEHRAAWKNPGA